MKYAVSFLEKALEQLNELDKPIKEQIYNKIGGLEGNCELGEPLSNDLKGSWKLHIGKYRVIYCVVGNNILITKIGHRKNVYE